MKNWFNTIESLICEHPCCNNPATHVLLGKYLCVHHALERTSPTGPPPRRIEP